MSSFFLDTLFIIQNTCLPVDNSLRFIARLVIGELSPHDKEFDESAVICPVSDMLDLVFGVPKPTPNSCCGFRFTDISGRLDILEL